MTSSASRLGLVLPALLIARAGDVCAATAADEAAGLAFFEARVRPVLVKHCYECHSVETGKSKGGLQLDSRTGIRTGGDTGPAVVPGQVDQSLLLAAVRHTDPDLEMPPRKPKLPASVIEDLEHWITLGAPDPRETTNGKAAERPVLDVEAGRRFWSYTPPVAHALPVVQRKDWPLQTIDHWVLAKLEAGGLSPAPDAPPVTRLRRLHLDLTGLPPSPEEVAEYLQELKGSASARDVWERRVNRLLESPRFGERWGRHWLDVARYAESNGRESNLTFPHAWRYRDYVIDAMNADVPFDRFITEQVAGDFLPAKDEAEKARLMIATGFLALGAKGLNEMNKAQFHADLADEQVDTVTRAVLASSVACARCHDHKTDPFRMEDYYALAGIFKSTETFYGTWVDSENNNGSHLLRLPDLPGQLVPNRPLPPARVAELKANLARLNQEEKDMTERAVKARLEGKDLSGEAFEMLRNAIRILWTRGGIVGALETVDDTGRALPLCMGVKDSTGIQDSPVYERGEITHPCRTVPRGYPQVIRSAGTAPGRETSGRLELARWLTARDNPLTARVMANRVWRHLFGTGLVRTVDNFGFSGERPSHPELLDHLALSFMNNGWSLKALIREVVLSRTYQQASAWSAHAFEKDPDNRLLWRMSKRRLDAEVIRDSMLAVSGQLDTSRRPGSLVAELDGQSVSLIGFNTRLPPDLDGSRRRSVYLPVLRDQLPDVLEQFDAANPNLVTGDRDVTNVPLQALYLMNGPFVQAQAAALATRVTREAGATPEARLHRAWELCFNRLPTAAEQALALNFLQTAPGTPDEVMRAFCQSLLASAEFRMAD